MKIVFNPDGNHQGGSLDKEQRATYLKLCKQLTSREPDLDYPKITAEILAFTKKEALAMIPVEYSEAKKIMIGSSIESFFAGVPEDTNYIGKVNLICLQCILLFTEHCMDPAAKTFPVNLNDTFEFYSYLKSINWRSYIHLRAFIVEKNWQNRQVKNLYLTTSEPSNGIIYLVTILDYLTISEIIETCLDNIILCGMISKFEYADGNFFSPYQFLEHDITHGNNFQGYCFVRLSNSQEDIKSFYKYCVNGHLSSKEEYGLKLMIFFLIHESHCDFFPSTENKDLTIEFIINSLTTTRLINMERFVNPNDLGKAFPKAIQDKPAEEKPAEIMKYLTECAVLYQREFHSWRMAEKKYGGKRKNQKRSRKSRKPLRKTRKRV